MKALLYLNIQREPSFVFESSLAAWAKSAIPEVVFFDMDNFSDQASILSAMRLIDDAEKVCLIIEAAHQAPIAHLMKLIEKIIKNKQKCCFIINGHHDALLRMGRVLGSHFFHNLPDDVLHETILHFFNNSHA
jgi:hypothetical protein